MKLLRLILLLLPLLSFSQGYHRSKISKETLKVVREIKKFPFLSLHTIENEAPITGDSYFKDLYNTATPQELIELTNHPDSKVRCYAFSCVAITDRDSLFSIIKSHLNDDEIVRTQAIYYIPERGAEGHRDAIMVGDYFIQVATDTFRKQPILTDMQLHELDSLIVHSKTDLRYRKEVVDRLLKGYNADLHRKNNKIVDTSAISVISVEKANMVYRGVTNPIKIAVPGAKSYTVEANGNLQRKDSLGNYYWNVTSAAGTKGIIKIDAVMLNGNTKHEEKIFQIKGIPPIMAYINGNYEDRVYNMTRQQIKDLKIDVTINNLYFEVDKRDVTEFVFIVADSTYYNTGNKIEPKYHDVINELQNGSEITLRGIIFWKSGGDGPRVQGIKIRVADDPLPDNYIPKPILSVEKANIIYRGIDNPIKIIVPEAKSFKVTAPGNLRKIDNDGNYLYNVTSVSGTKAIVKFEITTARDSIVYETKEYFINQIKDGKTTINGKNNIECNLELTKKELIESTVGIKIDDFYIDNGIRKTVSFEIYLPGINAIIVRGNKMDDNVINKIKLLPKGSVITIVADSEYKFRIISASITLTD